jgi:hypothetical protein
MKRLFSTLTVLIVLLSLNTIVLANNENDKNSTNSAEVATTSVTGSVVDQNTGEELTGVKVQIEDIDVDTYTDFMGNFTLNNLKPGKYEVTVSYVSYEKKTEKVNISIEDENKIKIKLSNAEK